MVLSLFPGIGLLDMAFEAEGFTVVRGPDVLWGGDIRTFHPPAGVFDGVIGGPPCQAFSSLAHLVRANGGEPRFGNLIPEFERCVLEASPGWFLMENVPAAPVAMIGPHLAMGDDAARENHPGYRVTDFVICNSWLDAGDGLGEEQMRKRRWSFGVLGADAPDLRRWIKPAALLLPEVSRAVHGHDPTPTERDAARRTSAVVADPRETPVAIGGSGKRKHRTGPVLTGGQEKREVAGRLTSGKRRTVAEMCRLQGLPEDFLDDAPFTVAAKRKAIANGVPIPMGRAIARAVREAVDREASTRSEP